MNTFKNSHKHYRKNEEIALKAALSIVNEGQTVTNFS